MVYTGAKKQIHLLLDNELQGADQVSLIEKIDSDPKISSLFEKEKNFRDYVKSNIKRPSASENLLNTIRHQLNLK